MPKRAASETTPRAYFLNPKFKPAKTWGPRQSQACPGASRRRLGLQFLREGLAQGLQLVFFVSFVSRPLQFRFCGKRGFLEPTLHHARRGQQDVCLLTGNRSEQQ